MSTKIETKNNIEDHEVFYYSDDKDDREGLLPNSDTQVQTNQEETDEREKLKNNEKVIHFALKLTVLKYLRDISATSCYNSTNKNKIKSVKEKTLSEDEIAKRREIKKLWVTFLQDFTLNGFRHVFEKGIIRRIIWLFILIFAIMAVCFSAKKSITKYFNRPITTTVNMVYKDEIIFPAVTLCNFNFFPHYLINGTIGEKVGLFFS